MDNGADSFLVICKLNIVRFNYILEVVVNNNHMNGHYAVLEIELSIKRRV